MPSHFKEEHVAGKDMGFADYLSRNPNSPPTGECIDGNHVINLIQAQHYTLHSMLRKTTNQKAKINLAQQSKEKRFWAFAKSISFVFQTPNTQKTLSKFKRTVLFNLHIRE